MTALLDIVACRHTWHVPETLSRLLLYHFTLAKAVYPYGSYTYTPGHFARHRSARWMKNYNNDDDMGEDRYIRIYSLVVTTAI